MLDCFSNRSTTDALNANFESFGSATGDRSSDFLQVGTELPTSNSGLFGTDTTEILGFTPGLFAIPRSSSGSGDLAATRHDRDPVPGLEKRLFSGLF